MAQNSKSRRKVLQGGLALGGLSATAGMPLWSTLALGAEEGAALSEYGPPNQGRAAGARPILPTVRPQSGDILTRPPVRQQIGQIVEGTGRVVYR